MNMTADELDILNIYNMSPDLMCIASARTGKFLQVNDSFTSLLGHSRETLLSKVFLDFVHHDDVESTGAMARQLGDESSTTYFFENRYRTSTGAYVSIAWGCRAKNGKLYATGKDISSIRSNSAMIFNDLEQLTRTGSWTLCVRDLSLTWSEHLYMLHELQVGTPIDLMVAANFFVEGDKIFFLSSVYRCLTTGNSFDNEFRITSQQGNVVWVRCCCKAICDAEQNIVEIQGTVRNITISKNSELLIKDATKILKHQQTLLAKEHLLVATSEHSNSEKSKFVANMSHEMRTPLAAIIGFVELMQSDPVNTEEYLSIIFRNATHLASLVDDVLDLSKIEADQLTLDIKTVELATELDHAIAMLERQALLKGLVIRKFYDHSKLHRVKTDPRRLRQILVNVIANAIKFTASGYIDFELRSIQHESQSTPESFVIAIIDTGPGIAPDMHEKIFECFHQGGSSTSRTYGGTGLGLALSRQLATLLGGSIVCRNSTIGEGSTFEVTLPANDSTNTDEADTQNATNILKPMHNNRKSLAGLRILLIDDAPDIRLLLSVFLNALGAKIEIAENGLIGIEKALAMEFDVIVMDIKMPVMDGRVSTQKLRESGCATPIIALSADATKEEKDLCLAVGINEYCSKPISQEELNRVVLKWSKQPATLLQ